MSGGIHTVLSHEIINDIYDRLFCLNLSTMYALCIGDSYIYKTHSNEIVGTIRSRAFHISGTRFNFDLTSCLNFCTYEYTYIPGYTNMVPISDEQIILLRELVADMYAFSRSSLYQIKARHVFS